MSEAKVLTNEILGSIMPRVMIERSCASKKIEDCKQTGMYVLDGSWTTEYATPIGGWNIGLLEVIVRYNGSDIIQRLTIADSGRMFVRVMRAQAWKPWREITTELISGGGKPLSLNYLRSFAERRVA